MFKTLLRILFRKKKIKYFLINKTEQEEEYGC